MVEIAIGTTKYMSASDIEFGMKKPSYSVDTLKQLQINNPHKEFVLIMGSDNAITIDKWKDYQYILKNFTIYVYDRDGYEIDDQDILYDEEYYSITIFSDCPKSNLSSTFIRESIVNGKDVKYFLPGGVNYHIDINDYYKK